MLQPVAIVAGVERGKKRGGCRRRARGGGGGNARRPGEKALVVFVRPQRPSVCFDPNTQLDGSCCVVGVCHAANTPRGCPGHPLALRSLADATACCLGCGDTSMPTADAVKRARANGGDVKQGTAILEADGQVTGWMCLTCLRQ